MMDLQEDTDETFRAQFQTHFGRFIQCHAMPCHAMPCCVAKLPPRLVKMREQEGFSLPGEIDDSQAAQAFVPPMG